jgi:flagellar basal-body rod protein FlgB
MAGGAIDSVASFQAQALELQAERGRVLASNIANADTPNYKARDFNFQQALAAATHGAGTAGRLTMTRTNAAHLTGAGAGTGSPSLMYRAPLQSSVDGNTVDLDVERANFAQNSLRYEATLRFLNGHLKQKMTAINGQ